MSTDVPTDIAPRKKPNLLWWTVGLIAGLLVLFFLQLFGPSPGIIVSKQTTHITEPLTAGGLPDYSRFYLERSRDGVTAENNAAALILPALWPAEYAPAQFAAVAAELGLAEIPTPADTLVRLHDNANRAHITDWLRQQNQARAATGGGGEGASAPATPAVDPFGTDPYRELAERVLDRSMARPWTSAEIPPLAKWIADNQRPLDQLVEGTRRPRIYLPSPNLIDGSSPMLIGILLPGIQACREVGRALSARAMWHVGEGRPMEAWQDLHAVHRLSRLLAKDSRVLVEHLVAIAISNMACTQTQALLHHGNLTAEQARQVQRDLAALGGFGGVVTSLGQWERMMTLDLMLRLSRQPEEAVRNLNFSVGDAVPGALNVLSIDWNVALREANRWYDRLEAVAAIENRVDREAALANLNVQMDQLGTSLHSAPQWAGAVLSRRQRSQVVAEVTLSLVLPALSAALQAQDRGNIDYVLVQLAAALAVYRAETGTYPDTLDALVPGVMPQLPVDLFHGKPFVYQRDGEGYLLYSTGSNGVDENGSNEDMRVFQGQPLDDLDDAQAEPLLPQIPRGADDHSIRVPRPTLSLPTAIPPAGEPRARKSERPDKE
jgi:hypothetical protein